MFYKEDFLLGDEEIIYKEGSSFWAHQKSLLFGGVLLFIGWPGEQALTQHLILIGLAFLTVPSLKMYSVPLELVITNKRILKFGVLRLENYEFKLANVENIRVVQSTAGRIFSFGHVLVETTGANVPMLGVKNPMLFKQKVTQIQEDTEES